MEEQSQVFENKAKIKMLEDKLQALVNVLSKEGIISSEDVENELNDVIGVDENENNVQG